MNVLSVNVGLPREVQWHKVTVSTGIFKHPVEGRIILRKLNFDGDRQADLTVHGGEYKAVYCYPIEHYPYWKRELGVDDLAFASFGENLTTQGLTEDSVHLGDRLIIGSAELAVTQPRLPCYKLGIKFQSDDMVRRFLASGRTGFYLKVEREGEIAAGDPIEVISRDPNAVSISRIAQLYVAKQYSDEDAATVHAALLVPSFPESWKKYLSERLASRAH